MSIIKGARNLEHGEEVLRMGADAAGAAVRRGRQAVPAAVEQGARRSTRACPTSRRSSSSTTTTRSTAVERRAQAPDRASGRRTSTRCRVEPALNRARLAVRDARRARASRGWLARRSSLAFVLLPWYFQADVGARRRCPACSAAPTPPAALVQAARHGRPWLWSRAARPRARRARLARCRPAVRRAAGGSPAAPLGARPARAASRIGAQGWSFEALTRLRRARGRPVRHRPGRRADAAGAADAARRRHRAARLLPRRPVRRGARSCCAARCWRCSSRCRWPRRWLGAFFDEAGQFSLAALASASATSAPGAWAAWPAGVRCGVAWNTLFLALLTAAGTTVLGTMIALLAERGGRRLAKPLNVLALLPIITPPFVVGLGLILLFGRAGLVNQLLECGLRHHADALVLRPVRHLAGAAVRVHADRLHDHARRRRRRSVRRSRRRRRRCARPAARPSRRSRCRCSSRGWPTPSWSASSRASPISATRSSSAGSTRCCRRTSSSRSSARSTTRAGRHRWRSILTLFALAVFCAPAARCSARASYTTVSGKGDAGLPMPLPQAVRRACSRDRAAVARVHAGRLPVRVRRRLRADLGPRLHADARALPSPRSTCSGASSAWSGPARRGTRCSRP